MCTGPGDVRAFLFEAIQLRCAACLADALPPLRKNAALPVCIGALESNGSERNDTGRATRDGQEISAAPRASGEDLLGMRQLLRGARDALRQRFQPHAAPERTARRRLVSIRRLGHRMRGYRKRTHDRSRRAVTATSCLTGERPVS
ncbi:hypothetical protein EMIT0111MI5_30082 [Burkholderia sp. IT-111MI5]